MEGLKKLEQVQGTITSMKSRGIISPSSSSSTSNSPESDRFLVDVALLLMQPYGELGIEKKCKLIYDNLPKISASFLDETLPCFSEEGNCEQKACSVVSQNNSEDMAMIGVEAMQNANSTLEDFCRSYFMFHDLDVNSPHTIFRYLPILSFTESYIYQLDRLNEKLLKLPTTGEQHLHVVPNQMQVNRFETDLLRPLAVLLERNGLLTERIRNEFRCGEEYWTLERKLCCALASNEKILVEDVMRAINLKSFDYRVLNLLLYQLRGEEVNDLYMEFLSVSEFLVELSDDLFDYEDDVLENSFNVLRMFVRIYGASETPAMLAKCIGEAEDKYSSLLKALDPKLSANYQKRCEDATREGGKVSGPSLGTWTIPPVIADEDSYRSEILNST